MSKILITGGAGFIGSHLCEQLLAQGHQVICLDNFFSGSKKNIEHLLTDKNFLLVEADVEEPYQFVVEQIYNLACPAAPIWYRKDPVKTVRTNVLGAINALELAKKLNCPVLQTSTSEVYGNPQVHPQPENYWGNVNPFGPRACYSSDTEVLTKDGWKLFKNISKNDEVLTLSNHHIIEYQKPTEIIKDYYKGQLVGFKNYHCDLLVTPNHKMYVKRRSDNNKEFFNLLPAFSSINWDRSHMLKVAEYEGSEKEWFYFPEDINRKNSKAAFIEKIKMDDWLEFFGYYITEGCVSIMKRKKKINNKEYITNDYRVLIAQSKNNHENYDKIKKCLIKLPFNFVDSYDHQFCITNKQLANYLISFGKSHEKYLPRELLNVSRRQLKILFKAMMLGDGNKKGTYYSNSFRLISDFQEVLLKIGYAGNIAAHDKRKVRPVYQIHVLNRFNRKYRTPTYSERYIENYDDFVYCVNVPNHIIFVRRNGKALFCGNCYDEGKRCAETLFFDYWQEYRVKIKVVRIFNTYGPRMATSDGRAIPNFIYQALAGQDLTIYGDGGQTRSFCYIDDMVKGLVMMMDSTDEIVSPINLGNPQEFSIKQLAEKIIELTNSKSKIVYNSLPKDDPTRRQPDIRLAKEKLGWQPEVALEQGLIKTIEYFKSKIR